MKMKHFKLSKSSLSRLETCDPRIQEIIKESIKNSPIDFGIPQYGGKRTAKEQYSLYEKGLSKCDGYKHLSYHQSGMAVDFFAYVDGKASWEEIHLTLIAGHILGIAKSMGYNLEWGGFFKSFKDLPHLQLRYT